MVFEVILAHQRYINRFRSIKEPQHHSHTICCTRIRQILALLGVDILSFVGVRFGFRVHTKYTKRYGGYFLESTRTAKTPLTAKL